MSAFVVSDNHINAIVTFANMKCLADDVQAAAQLLLDANIKSVTARYGECDEDGEIKFRFNVKPVSPVQILKACDCFEYQACEASDWPQSKAKELIDDVRRAAVRSLPGYSDAAWEIK